MSIVAGRRATQCESCGLHLRARLEKKIDKLTDFVV